LHFLQSQWTRSSSWLTWSKHWWPFSAVWHSETGDISQLLHCDNITVNIVLSIDIIIAVIVIVDVVILFCLFTGSVCNCRANLSELYFTHRQDRYVMLSNCPLLADFFDQLVSCVQRYSFNLLPDDSVQLADGVTCHPFAGNDGFLLV